MTINPTIPTVGSPRGSEEIDIVNALTIMRDAINQGTGPALVASLPISPTDGQEVYYLADGANGIIWHLKYRAGSASAYKWEFVGGSPLIHEVTPADTISSAAYAAAPTNPGPSITVPLAGDYDVEIRGRINHNGAGGVISFSYAVGATAASDADYIVKQSIDAGEGDSGVRLRRKTGLAAATALVSHYKVNAGTGTVADRSMAVRPVRVG